MERSPIEFAFERSAVMLPDGTSFRPQKDAGRRWVLGNTRFCEVKGANFGLLYELPGATFIQVDCLCCIPRQHNVLGVEVWFPSVPPKAEVLEPVTALKRLIDAQLEIPQSLEPYVEKLHAEASIIAAEVVPRPIDHWAGRVTLGVTAVQKAHSVDAVATAKDVLAAAIRAVQVLRTGKADRLRALEAKLFGTYPVAAENWWGPKDRVPPATVGILDLWWPPGANDVRAALQAMQELLRTPLSVASAAQYWISNPDRPTTDEKQAGEAALVGCANELERLVLTLRDGLNALEVPRDIPVELPAKLKPPSRKAFVAFRLWMNTGKTQAEIARTMIEEFGMTADQGNVSRWKAEVLAWIEACKVIPPMPEPIRRKPATVDPKVIDQGGNQERRTPRQRPKKKEK